ncbi:2-keto-3-deoxygluconate transporter [Trinickia caryophylli]|uniref:2-keto-3-deoxygluconate permease n=1 Tax=Trinickia caryophylli TaxID=28094 RepID=A0A1X7FD11_TRICW|nr:2-keto-3-deoxygluconate transporter [Trinickia caryophylli]PMS10879.1 2-keto-3-deoxygluconate transporter [Trinickia caryophylli]TRX18822.1 2-keto-3-deoxygluconate transporter [Trinickia caryophylli]WQE10379.1 2-keto-3-deoxygluconate transporter [Trinickia caryophylli]SMF49907.1 2-keto-3-deoxygluconate permease [Trinickia caryophylli]GLU34171.1 2-keto-3-deoxygluconate permease [Trinickia caryophylli]
MNLKNAIDRIPGGLMLVPMVLGACVHTFAPGAGKYLGSFTNGLISGTVPILAVWFFCMGATIDLRATGVVLRKSGTLVLTKILVAWLATLLAAQFIPDDGIKSGVLAGLSLLAITAAMDMTNGGLYAAVMQQYGTKEEAGAFVLMSIESGPLVSMFILGATGVAVFEARLFVGAVLPFLIGFALGNLDKQLRELFGRCVVPLIPFFGFALGNGIDLGVIAKSGLPGLLLGLVVIVITGIPLMLSDKLIGGGNGTAGLAASSTAGAAVANPAIIGEMVPKLKPMVPAATALVATACLVTAILVPILTAMWARRVGNGAARSDAMPAAHGRPLEQEGHI